MKALIIACLLLALVLLVAGGCTKEETKLTASECDVLAQGYVLLSKAALSVPLEDQDSFEQYDRAADALDWIGYKHCNR